MVAYSLVDTASSWVQNCGFDFPLAVDTERELYVSLGLPRSVLIWTIPTLIKYAEQLRAGIKLLTLGKGDDVHQMGGDFVVDSAGKLAYIYRGKTSYDRPLVKDLIAALKQLQNPNSDN
jgi:hypothetical protein